MDLSYLCIWIAGKVKSQTLQGSAPESAVNLEGLQRHNIEATLTCNTIFLKIVEKMFYEAKLAFF